ncbi:MAG TPA: M50 family metallopeptidase, partial [Lacunisphaera sp.]|nr:M50 family metallopeptidase [Lacunisphaera sp.]
HKDRPVVLTVERHGQFVDIPLSVTPKDKPNPLTGLLISVPNQLLHDTPWHQFYEIIDTTFRTIWSLISPRGDLSVSNLSGPIGITRGFWDATQSEYPVRFAIWFAILVNLNLAIFNLLPIPVLDGGQMLFATIGKLRGRALPVNFIAATQSVFIVLLLTMVAYVSFFDVRRWTRDVQTDRADAQAKEAAAEQQKKAAEPVKP